MDPLKIGNDRQLFWDNYLINPSFTSAVLKQHHPRREEIALTLDAPWEGDGCIFSHIVNDNGRYRMYYVGKQAPNPGVVRHSYTICMVESDDGINWRRPNLGLVEFNGSTDNNILFNNTVDTFYVFIDTNPASPAAERYKAIGVPQDPDYEKNGLTLWCYTSVDGIHWDRTYPIVSYMGIHFDSLNTAMWNPETRLYHCYFRSNHGVRDIRLTTSPDLVNWTEPVLLDFGGAEDIELYTNGINLYPYAKGMFLGKPTRYLGHREWNDNFAQLAGAEARLDRMQADPRFGLAATDCTLMTSRDGYHWSRWDEAWMTPGIEGTYNWVYGDCYPTPEAIPTKSDIPGAPDELSFFDHEKSWSRQSIDLRRYTIRRDGYFSYRADRAEKKLVTKPLLYEGGLLSLNFSTSVFGYIYVTLHCEGQELHSCELFGDTLDRRVNFEKDLTALKGKEITLEFRMSDADLYSMVFEKTAK